MYDFVSIDFETADPQRDSACAIGLARVEGAEIVRRESRLIRPPRSVHPACQAVHGLTWSMLKGQPSFGEVMAELAPMFAGVEFVAAHNVQFDRAVLTACCQAAQIDVPAFKWVCTLALAKKLQPKPHDLKSVCARLGVTLERHHEAGADAEACARVLIALEGRQGGATERDRLIAATFARAAKEGKHVYAFTTDFASCDPVTHPGKVADGHDRICVEGDATWTPLSRFQAEPDEM